MQVQIYCNSIVTVDLLDLIIANVVTLLDLLLETCAGLIGQTLLLPCWEEKVPRNGSLTIALYLAIIAISTKRVNKNPIIYQRFVINQEGVFILLPSIVHELSSKIVGEMKDFLRKANNCGSSVAMITCRGLLARV